MAERHLQHPLILHNSYRLACLAIDNCLPCSCLYLAKLSRSLCPHISRWSYVSVIRFTEACAWVCNSIALLNDKQRPTWTTLQQCTTYYKLWCHMLTNNWLWTPCALRPSLPWSPSRVFSQPNIKWLMFCTCYLSPKSHDAAQNLLDKYGLHQQLEQLLTLWHTVPKSSFCHWPKWKRQICQSVSFEPPCTCHIQSASENGLCWCPHAWQVAKWLQTGSAKSILGSRWSSVATMPNAQKAPHAIQANCCNPRQQHLKVQTEFCGACQHIQILTSMTTR